MKSTEISTTFNITKTDAKIIDDIVGTYSGTKLDQARQMLLRVFGRDTNQGHCMYLGYIIGEQRAAAKQRVRLNQIIYTNGCN